jgi:protocatechuate 4,5-dioxygenase alpha chain
LKVSWKKHDYESIPGTYVFDGKTANPSFALNKLLFSFNHEENRKAYAEDPAAYADKYGLTDEQKQALLSTDLLGLLKMGANIYYMAKLAIPNGVSVQDVGAAFHGITTAEFQAHLDERSAGFREKLEQAGGYWNG